MGLDMRLILAKSKEEIEQYELAEWEDSHDEALFETDLSTIQRPYQVWYARKFWDMMYGMSFLCDYECGDYCRLSKNDLKEMIDFYSYHPDYFYGFDGLPRLCELYQVFSSLTNAGLNLYFEADW